MKLGFYSPYLDTFGGGERYLLTLASNLSKNHDVDVFWNDNTIKAPLTRFLKIDLAKISFVKNIFSLNFYQKLLKSRNYDLIFVLSDGSIPTTLSKNNILHFQVPFILRKPSLITRIKLSRYKWVIANSNFTKNFIDRSFGISSKVIYPPVDIKSIKSSIHKEEIILSVGRFSASQLHPKKQEVLIDVFKVLSKKIPTWRLILIGQAKKEDQKYLRKLKKSTRGFAIKIIENASADELRHIYSKTSIYWHATGFSEEEDKHPERMEHFGIATVEAQAAGAVPVVINKGGQKEIVTNYKDGLLWSTKTELFDSTLKLINDQNLFIKLSKNAIKNCKRFRQEKFIAEYEKIFSSI